MDIGTTLCGIHLSSPLLPGSGPLTGDSERMIDLSKQGLGAVVTKTISTEGAAVQRPCIVKKGSMIMNCEAWSEYPARDWIERFIPETRKAIDVPIIASVGYCSDDYKRVVPEINNMVSGYECVPRFHDNSGNYDEVGECVKAFRKLTDKPIWVKMSGNKPDSVGFAGTCLKNGANGVVAITSLGPCMAIDIANRRPMIGLATGYSWASGPAIKPLALSTVYMIKEAYPDISIIGSGGVVAAEDVLEFLLAGADAVEMLSQAMMAGKDAYSRIIRNLPGKLEKFGFKNIDDVKNTRMGKPNPNSFARYPVISKELCSGCGLCIINCPYSALSGKGKTINVNTNKCFGCGLCQSACPVKAISNVLV